MLLMTDKNTVLIHIFCRTLIHGFKKILIKQVTDLAPLHYNTFDHYDVLKETGLVHLSVKQSEFYAVITVIFSTLKTCLNSL